MLLTRRTHHTAPCPVHTLDISTISVQACPHMSPLEWHNRLRPASLGVSLVAQPAGLRGLILLQSLTMFFGLCNVADCANDPLLSTYKCTSYCTKCDSNGIEFDTNNPTSSLLQVKPLRSWAVFLKVTGQRNRSARIQTQV